MKNALVDGRTVEVEEGPLSSSTNGGIKIPTPAMTPGCSRTAVALHGAHRNLVGAQRLVASALPVERASSGPTRKK